MTTRSDLPPLDDEIASLLASEKILVAQPDHLKARAVARARASLSESLYVPSTWRERLWPGVLPAVAAGLVVTAAVAAVAAFQAHRGGFPWQTAAAPDEMMAPPEPRAAIVVDPLPFPALAAAPAEVAKVRTGARISVGSNEYAAELRLLRQARAAIARGAFADALIAIAEHTRRLPSGRLAEEREALRVRSLAGLRRPADARYAADAFRARFPRSVLLPRVDEMARHASD